MTQAAKKKLKWRIITIELLFLVLFIALISRAFQLQILSGKALGGLAYKQHTKTLSIQSERGIIFDRRGEKIAASVMSDSVCADPSKILNVHAVSSQLAKVLALNENTIAGKLSAASNFCWLARKIPPEQAQLVERLNLEGIFLIKEPKRFYPNGELAGHLIGFVGMDASGLEGLELKYDHTIQGNPAKLIWSRDAKGKKLFPRIEKVNVPNLDSNNLVLTIDSRIQFLVESHLREAIRSKGAKAGIAIVMDPKTGEILALANEPGFDPNLFSQYNPGHGKNRVITDSFDPGSTFKPFVVAGALEEGIVQETDRFYCENGNYTVADRVIHEAQRKRYGALTVHDILKYSSNIGSVKIAEKLGREKLYSYITQFGFGSKTGIDLPGEVSGLLRPLRNWTRVDAATIAFGQGISVTAIQLITALSAIANDGVLMKPYLVRAFVNPQGQMVRVFEPTVVRRVVSSETARRLTAILTDVVNEKDGTGKKAMIENIAVAGKTGTSQKFDFARRVYSSERVRTSFMGFFPAENPQIVMLISLDEPQRDKWGGMAAAPVFKMIGEQILTCFKTNIRNDAQPEDASEPTLPSPKAQLVSATVDLSSRSPKRMDDNEGMPDFRGMTVRQALNKAQQKGIDLKVVGSGWAITQEPSAGIPLHSNMSCTVSFSIGF